MSFFGELINLLDVKMETPQMYGWFHLLFLALSIIVGIILCAVFKNANDKTVKRIILTVSLTVIPRKSSVPSATGSL